MAKDNIGRWLRVRGWLSRARDAGVVDDLKKPQKKRKIYRIQLSIPLKFHHVAIRLTSEGTEFLQERIRDAVKRGVGVNLIFADLDGAIAFVHSRKRPEIVISAYTGCPDKLVKSPMRGYRGRWNHIEFYMDPGQAEALKKFLGVLENG